MANVRLEHLTHRFGKTAALEDVSLEIHDREVVTIVGPSGCGKSTLLRLVAGLEQPVAGSIYIDGELVNAVPARLRNIAMVFQSYALYPHMTCYENLALNLRLKRLPAAEIDRRVRETAKRLDTEHLLDKKPKQLSGGERQRIAVGRALIRDPQVFLFDEPLSNLDAQLRERVRHDLKELFQRVHATVLYVTHDQVEALTLADRVVVLDHGKIQQIGSPEELYRSPANRFVASFIGTPSMNIFETQLQNGRFQLGPTTLDTGVNVSGPVDVGIRPEAIGLGGEIAATVSWIENLGMNTLVGMRVAEVSLTALVSQRPSGSSITISIDPKNMYVFEKAFGSRLDRARGPRPVSP